MFLEKIENSSLGALVLHMTSNVTISRRCQDDNGKEMYQSVKRTCRACTTTISANESGTFSFRIRLPSTRIRRIRNFKNSLSRMDTFESDMNPEPCGRQIRMFFNPDNVTR